MSDPNGYQPQGGDQQNNGVSGAAQAPLSLIHISEPTRPST